MWQTVLKATGNGTFDPGRRWANGFMGLFKATKTTPAISWAQLKLCIDCAIFLEYVHKTCPVVYLDELGRTAMQRCTTYPTSPSSPDIIKRPKLLTFLDIAVWFRLASYVKIRGSTMKYQEIIHATRFRGLPWPLPESEIDHIRHGDLDLRSMRYYSTSTPAPDDIHFDYHLSAAAEMFMKAMQRAESDITAYWDSFSPLKMEEALETVLKLHKQEKWKGKLKRTKKKWFG